MIVRGDPAGSVAAHNPQGAVVRRRRTRSYGAAEMYEMYPEWGPALHRESYDMEAARESVQRGLDLRDNGGQRPDDN